MFEQVTARDVRELTLPWGAQVLLLAGFAVGYPLAVAGVYAGVAGSAGGIVAGSLLGAYPVFLMEVARTVKKPHLRVVEETTETPAGGGIVCKYPHRWYAYEADDDVDDELRLETHVSIDAARTIVTLHNDGWGRAQRCRVWIRLEEADTDGGAPEVHRFPARWEREDNPLELDLTPGESAEVTLSEVALYDRAFKTALSNRLSEEVRTTPHEYARAERFEIKRDHEYVVSVTVTADGMAIVERDLDLGNGRGEPVEIPGFADDATEWGVVGTLREDPERVCAVWYREDGEDRLVVEEGFDLETLRRADPSGQSELEGPNLPAPPEEGAYRDALADRGFVVTAPE